MASSLLQNEKNRSEFNDGIELLILYKKSFVFFFICKEKLTQGPEEIYTYFF
jgi:hypothetical protein